MKTRLLLTALFLLNAFSHLLAYDFEYKGLYFNILSIEDKTVEVCNGERYTGYISIPSYVEYNGLVLSVVSIGEKAFSYSTVTGVSIPSTVTKIGDSAFDGSSISEITIPENVKSIGYEAFKNCDQLVTLYFNAENCRMNNLTGFYFINDMPGWNNIEKAKIGSRVKKIPTGIFCRARIHEINIPSSVTSIEEKSFLNCPLEKIYIEDLASWCSIDTYNSGISGSSYYVNNELLTNLVIPEGVQVVNSAPFEGNNDIVSVEIPKSVKSLNLSDTKKIMDIYCLSSEPCPITSKSFYSMVFLNATLHVPSGSLSRYKESEGWRDFVNIVEGDYSHLEKEQCAAPKITYTNGILEINSETANSTSFYSIEVDDEQLSFIEYFEPVKLSVTYKIIAYSTATGYTNSETATATLCWLESDPKTEGINDITRVCTTPVLISSVGSTLNITGAENVNHIEFYNLSGSYLGAEQVINGEASFETDENLVIVKIGEKSVKVKK